MLGRRLITSAQVVLQDDPAIDHAACSYAAYVEAGYDVSKLAFVSGEQPTVFHIKPLTYRQRMTRDDITQTGSRIHYIFRAGLVGVDNYQLGDGPAPSVQREGDASSLVSVEWMERMGLPDSHMVPVVLAITAISEAALPLSKRSGPVSGAEG